MNKPSNSCVWFEIPVRDLEKGKAFYGKVLDMGFVDQTGGPNAMAIFDIEDREQKPAGHLYEGEPAADGKGATVHLATPALQQSLDRVKKAGGTVVSPAIEIPAGKFAYCRDPDGNSFALFEA